MVIVFLKNKLMSIDSIIPILIELKDNYDVESLIVVRDQKTFIGIKNNIVLYDAIKYVGSILYVGSHSSNKVLSKVHELFKLVKLLLYGFIGAKYIHFGLLNNGIYNILWKVHKNRVFYSKSDSYSHTHSNVRELVRRNPNSNRVIPFGASFISYDELLPHEYSLLSNVKRTFIFGETRTRYSWIHFSWYRADYYLKRYHPSLKDNERYIVYIVGSFATIPHLRESDSLVKLFDKTITSITRNYPDLKILIKPHVTTNMDILYEAQSNNDFDITYLHPSVLAKRAILFISNVYSSTLADGYNLCVPTVEFTDYKEVILERTNGKSFSPQYVDFFIINNDAQLSEALDLIIKKQYKNRDCKQKLENLKHDDDKSGLLSELAH
jgi:hypothetical protein